ncbi:MAG: YbhB/YbcL family Raf kinase inhibitor-like protein [Acidiferrobacteraceae bacterium]
MASTIQYQEILRTASKLLWYLSPILLSAPAFSAQFTLASRDFTNNGFVSRRYEYRGFGCHGQNVSPELSWTGAPRGTTTFILTVFDRSAVRLTKSGWWHWVVFNIPVSVHRLPEDASLRGLPRGAVEGRTDYGRIGYGGPCPPKGGPAHQYVFTLYALTRRLSLSAGATGAEVTYMARQDAIGRAHLVARFKR